MVMALFSKAGLQHELALRRYIYPIPAEFVEQDVIIFDCVFDLAFLDKLDKPSILYDHLGSRPDTFMHKEIVKRIPDPLEVLAEEKDHKWKLKAVKELYSKPDVILCNSRFIQNMLKQHFNVEAFVVNPPVDLEKFHPISNPTRDYFLSAQRMHWQKRVEIQVEAFTGLEEKLLIVGGNSEVLKYVVEDLSNITYLGRVKDEKLVSLMQNAKATIQTGFKEDFGLVPVESMACGTPCIVVDEGGFKETVHSPQLGIRIKPPYIENLRKAVQDFDSKKYDWKVLRKEAERYGLSRFKGEMEKYIRLAVEVHNGIHG